MGGTEFKTKLPEDKYKSLLKEAENNREFADLITNEESKAAVLRIANIQEIGGLLGQNPKTSDLIREKRKVINRIKQWISDNIRF